MDNATQDVERIEQGISPFTGRGTKCFPQYVVGVGETMFNAKESTQEKEMCRFEVNGVRSYDAQAG